MQMQDRATLSSFIVGHADGPSLGGFQLSAYGGLQESEDSGRSRRGDNLSHIDLEEPFCFGKDTTEGENTRFGVGPTQKGVRKFFFFWRSSDRCCCECATDQYPLQYIYMIVGFQFEAF